MSDENLEIVRRLYEATARQDVDLFVDLHAPSVTAIPLILEIQGGTYRGRDGIRRFWDEIHSAFPDWHWEAKRIRPFDGGALVDMQICGIGTGSGVRIDQKAWHVIRMRDGKVSWWRVCSMEAEALEAARLRGSE